MMTITATTTRTFRRLLLLAVALAAAAALLLAAPATATEASSEAPGDSASVVEDEVGQAETTSGDTGEGAAAEGEGGGKLTISDNPHDQFGLILFGLGGVAGLFALLNASSQLKGKRPATDGRIRWR